MKAFFPGSFNPFTTGHLDIVARALRVFDEVIIGIGYNEKKDSSGQSELITENLRNLFADITRVSILRYSDLTVEAAARLGANVIIRGYRNSIDAEYERQLASTNLLISGGKIDTWLMAARPQFECVSSSMVRELSHFGRSVDEFIPTPQQCEEECG